MRFETNEVCIWKVDNTLEQSVFEQLKWAINKQGVTQVFKIYKTPLRITCIPSRTIYAMDEIYEVKLSNRKLVERLIEREYHTLSSVEDSAEPKSTDEFKDHGVKVKLANKVQIQSSLGKMVKWSRFNCDRP